MKYLKDNGDPKLDLKNVISILISSDFLGMAQLVEECVKYVKLNVHDVVRLPIDMNCLNSSLIKKISNAVTVIHSLTFRLMNSSTSETGKINLPQRSI
jgi:hypothetical protein